MCSNWLKSLFIYCHHFHTLPVPSYATGRGRAGCHISNSILQYHRLGSTQTHTLTPSYTVCTQRTTWLCTTANETSKYQCVSVVIAVQQTKRRHGPQCLSSWWIWRSIHAGPGTCRNPLHQWIPPGLQWTNHNTTNSPVLNAAFLLSVSDISHWDGRIKKFMLKQGRNR